MTFPTMRLRHFVNALSLCVACLLFPDLATAQEPVSLPRIVVTQRTSVCPNSDSREARELWSAMAARYAPAVSAAPKTGQVARRGAYAQGTVLEEDLGTFANAEAAAGTVAGGRNIWSGTMLASQANIAAAERYRRGYYAAPVPKDEPRLLYQPVYLNWYYTRLDENFVDHIVDTAFASRHNLSLQAVPGGTVMAFCGRDRSRPWIEGTLALTRDTLVSHLAVRYFTRAPSEDAVSEAWFDLDANNSTSSRHLWPDRTIFYRRTDSPRVWFQEAWINVITCIWHDAAEARAGREPVLASRARGCTANSLR